MLNVKPTFLALALVGACAGRHHVAPVAYVANAGPSCLYDATTADIIAVYRPETNATYNPAGERIHDGPFILDTITGDDYTTGSCSLEAM